MMKRVWLVPPLLSLAFAGSLDVAAAPAALYGKSVVISWSETSQQRYVGEENFRTVQRSVQMSIYVSTQGRVFSRQTNTVGRAGTGSTEQVSGQRGGEHAPGAPRVSGFNGHEMALMGPLPGGIRHVLVSFDEGFTSCTATAGLAVESGKATTNGKSPINGRPLQITKVTAGSASCSIRDGNVFGGE
jgi:hypothetical protein